MASISGGSRDHKRFALLGEIDKTFTFHKTYKFCTLDVAFMTKNKSTLKDSFPRLWGTFENGTFKHGCLNGVGFAVYGCYGKYEG